MGNISGVLFMILMIAIFVAAILFLPRYLVMRAVPHVIRMFRKAGAVGFANAKYPHEIGFKEKGMLERVMSRRDYKPAALQGMIKAEIIRTTPEGKLYLSEEALAKTRWGDAVRPS
jgi:hypothetical protein